MYILLSTLVIDKNVKYGGALMGSIILVLFFDSTLQKLFCVCKCDNPYMVMKEMNILSATLTPT